MQGQTKGLRGEIEAFELFCVSIVFANLVKPGQT